MYPGLSYRAGYPVWRVDEDPMLVVEWPDHDVDLASVFVRVMTLPDGGGPSLGNGIGAQPSCVCDGGCACSFVVDGRTLPTGFKPGNNPSDFTFHVVAGGHDFSGNDSSATGQFDVTRMLWNWEPLKNGSPQPLPSAVPAIDPLGNLYVPTASGVSSLDPSGATRWESANGSPVNQTLYVPFADGGFVIFAGQVDWDGGGFADRLVVLAASDGARLFACDLPQPSIQSTAPVFVAAGSRGAVAMGCDDGATSSLVAVSFSTAQPGAFACSTTAVPFRAALNVAPVGIASAACFSALDTSVYCATINDGGTWAAPPTSGARVGGTITSLAVVGLNGRASLIGSVEPPDAGLFLLSTDFAAVAQTFPTPYPVHSGPVVVGRSQEQEPFALMSMPGLGDGVFAVGFDAGIPGYVNVPVPTGGNVVAMSDGKFLAPAYVEYRTFDLESPMGTSTLYYSWQTDMLDSNLFANIEGPTTVDCNHVTGRGGVSYGVDNAGRLHAVIIDTPGLDTAAAWPKYQRDPANSGNPFPDLLPLYQCH
jgi:hypothetical protein